MAKKNDETLGWGTLGFWVLAAGLIMTALVLGMLVPSGTEQRTETQISEPAPANPQQPAGPAR